MDDHIDNYDYYESFNDYDNIVNDISGKAPDNITTVKYILLTIQNRTVRVAVGIQDGHTPIAYWMERGNIFSYVLFQGCMTEAEGNEILAAAEGNDYRKACRLFRNYFRGEYSDKVYVEEGEWRPISEEVPDDWFDECKEIMSLMTTNIRDVFVFKRDEEIW